MFSETRLRALMEDVAAGRVTADEALASLRSLPFEDMGFAKLDHHRALRVGYPEVVYCENKTPEQVAAIFAKLAARSDRVLGTRANKAQADATMASLPAATFDPVSRCIWIDSDAEGQRLPGVALIAAGTSDMPVAEEAARTLEMMGCQANRYYDVGVAGLHRLLQPLPELQVANVIVVVAGMEGALASVVGGLVSAPIIAVPTSVGYGAHFQGLAPLLSMLNSCASGVSVVNIDNGFGGAYVAASINRRIHDAAKTAHGKAGAHAGSQPEETSATQGKP